MNIVFLAHPPFLSLLSMNRYVSYLMSGMQARGHTVERWQPEASFYNWSASATARKWLGYADQYVVFPQQVRRRIRQLPANTLFVLTDHALGPYVPLVASRPHVIHCHDFLAQRSALGELPENPTGWTGRRYQQFIRNGFRQGRQFISISAATQHDLHQLLGSVPPVSEVVYNGLLDTFAPNPDLPAPPHDLLRELLIDVSNGFLLHVGGNQWYKNRVGVVRIYEAWRAQSSHRLPLLLAGPVPDSALLNHCNQSPVKSDIHFLTNTPDTLVRKLYQRATLLLFPSLAEGFGWPIIEAMASGCPVVTTDAPPMTEVADGAAFLIPRLAYGQRVDEWATSAAATVDRVVHLTASARDAVVAAGLLNLQRFGPDTQLDRIERLYKHIVSESFPD